MSRIKNPFSTYIREPKELTQLPTLVTQLQEALAIGNIAKANAIAKTLGLPSIYNG